MVAVTAIVHLNTPRARKRKIERETERARKILGESETQTELTVRKGKLGAFSAPGRFEVRPQGLLRAAAVDDKNNG